MYSVLTAFLEQGDEVIMFEPFFDQYLPSVTFNGGKPVYVPLHPPASHIKKPTSDDWTIDMDELRYVYVSPMYVVDTLSESRVTAARRAVTPRTKIIIINTPHNPVGKVFTRKELQGIADIAEEFNLLIMSDEVVSIAVALIPYNGP
jgi:kynurenine aminotransferase